MNERESDRERPIDDGTRSGDATDE